MSFTILNGKEQSLAPSPLLLVDITDADGNTRHFATQAVTYGGNVYSDRLVDQNIQAIQGMTAQGFASIPSLSIQIADPDAFVWSNYITPHRWKGGTMVVTFVMYYASTDGTGFSTDSYKWKFITGNPVFADGIVTVEGANKLNFARIKLPTVAIQRLCPWIFPATAAQRQDAAQNKISPYYQCGYSPDATGSGSDWPRGNNDSGTGLPYTECQKTREACTARGMFAKDSANRDSYRFGGITWSPPTTYGGRKYTSGEKVYGFNPFNDARFQQVHSLGYGTHWVNAKVMVPAADPNSVRFEASVELACYGGINGAPGSAPKVLCNGVEIPLYNPNGKNDFSFIWYFVNAGGRTGHITTDAIFDTQGDPYGSIASIEVVVPTELAQAGSIPQCRVLCTAGPIMVPTTPSGDYGLLPLVTHNPAWIALDMATWCDYTYDDVDIQSVMDASVICGYKGSVTVSGATVTYVSGSGDPFCLSFAGRKIVINGSVFTVASVASATELTLTTSGASSGSYSVSNISYTDLNGNTSTHERYRASFALEDRKVAAAVFTAFCNAHNLILGQNPVTGKLQMAVKQTLAEQQPSAVDGSNYSTAVSSKLADGTTANGYAAYLFDETSIQPKTFKVTARSIAETPNKVVIQFQDAENQYQGDSVSIIDPDAYTAAGQQEIALQSDFLGTESFDQSSRIGNLGLAEANRGNPRDDAGGTLQFEFRTSMKAIHLTARAGLICLLSWAQLGLSQQPIRILSVKPSTDGRYWDIKAQWHNDDWYLDAYGQDPTPLYHNPYTDTPASVPLPWRPSFSSYSSQDALYNGDGTFQAEVNNRPNQDGSNTPVISISGFGVVNKLSTTVQAPLVPLQGQAASTGGHLAAGNWYAKIAALDSSGGLSSPSQTILTVIPAGVTTGTLTIPNLSWSANTTGFVVWIGNSVFDLEPGLINSGTPAYIGTGTPTSITIQDRASNTLGGVPDLNAQSMLIQAARETVSGIWEGAALTLPAADQVQVAGAPGWTANQWVGRVVSVMGNSATGIQTASNYIVTANTADTLTLDHTYGPDISVGDWLAIRMTVSSATSSTVADTALSMTTNAHRGERAVIIAGTGSGYPPQTIAANDATSITLAGSWPVTPDSTSVWIIIEASWSYEQSAGLQTTAALSSFRKIADVDVTNYAGQNVFVQAVTQDSQGNSSVSYYAPFRELHIFGATAVGQITGAGTPY